MLKRLFKAIILISCLITGFFLLQGIKKFIKAELTEEFLLQHHGLTEIWVKPRIASQDLISTMGLFSAPSCYMAGYDLTGVIQSALQTNLLNTGAVFNLIFDTGTFKALTPH